MGQHIVTRGANPDLSPAVREDNEPAFLSRPRVTRLAPPGSPLPLCDRSSCDRFESPPSACHYHLPCEANGFLLATTGLAAQRAPLSHVQYVHDGVNGWQSKLVNNNGGHTAIRVDVDWRPIDFVVTFGRLGHSAKNAGPKSSAVWAQVAVVLREGKDVTFARCHTGILYPRGSAIDLPNRRCVRPVTEGSRFHHHPCCATNLSDNHVRVVAELASCTRDSRQALN